MVFRKILCICLVCVKCINTMFLQASKYFKDYNSTHCTPLPADMFQMPWDVNVETDYVFT